jgi:hypothetical protein
MRDFLGIFDSIVYIDGLIMSKYSLHFDNMSCFLLVAGFGGFLSHMLVTVLGHYFQNCKT